MVEIYGPLVRLWGIEPSQLPPSGANPDTLKSLLTSILQEALPFITTVPATSSSSPTSPWYPKGVKNFPNSTAPVYLYERPVSTLDLQAVAKAHNPPGIEAGKVNGETWALRRSVHENKPVKGTATWDEFVKCFKEEHAESEKDFTPSVLSTKLEQEWDCSGITIDINDTTWANLTLKRESSLHNLPTPLKNRLFPVIQVTASAQDRREFIVVQIAVRETAGEHGDGSIVRAAYTSVEVVRETESGLEWIMGTVSDAKGIVPAWMQRLAVPGQIAKDVDMFLVWIDGERKKKKNELVGDSKHSGEGPEAKAP